MTLNFSFTGDQSQHIQIKEMTIIHAGHRNAPIMYLCIADTSFGSAGSNCSGKQTCQGRRLSRNHHTAPFWVVYAAEGCTTLPASMAVQRSILAKAGCGPFQSAVFLSQCWHFCTIGVEGQEK